MNIEDATISFHDQIVGKVIKKLSQSEYFNAETVDRMVELVQAGELENSELVASALRAEGEDQIEAT